MIVDALNEILIDRSVDDVAGLAADPNRAPNWYVNIESVEWKTTPPMDVGTQLAFVAHFLRRRLAYTYQIVEWVPNKRLVMRTAEGPFPMETTYEWESVTPSQTPMTLRNRGTPTGFSRLLAPMMKGAVNRANKKDLACLKRLLEAPG